MLDWLKRKTAAAPREQLVENENRAPWTEEKVERLVVQARRQPQDGRRNRPKSSDTNRSTSTELSPVSEVAAVSDAAAVAEVAPVTETAAVPEIVPAPETVPAAAGRCERSSRLQRPRWRQLPRFRRAPSHRIHELARVSSPTRVIAVAARRAAAARRLSRRISRSAGMVGQGPVVLTDTDPQGSLDQWWQARGDNSLALATVKLDDLAASRRHCAARARRSRSSTRRRR